MHGEWRFEIRRTACFGAAVISGLFGGEFSTVCLPISGFGGLLVKSVGLSGWGGTLCGEIAPLWQVNRKFCACDHPRAAPERALRGAAGVPVIS
ncbi:hypothetical protein EB810_04490 [Altererythrobacter sp. FM1]|nr:hypothetical protein EB810_04490 [Altererythrobacter sp. FM1]